ncbi:unnamed protein product [Thlaspi arvense]|uniref:EF-hand domain-containing protein n=1 Tax=Thlaspi arvense TaxID=13288 RepID=A0AAU9S7U1_THLAR|nr:unnamed protein product [Thlaspi arvense]
METKRSVYLQDMDQVRKVFNKFDADGSGTISLTELIDVLKALGSYTSDDEVKRMMEEIDTDHDGLINWEEFSSFCKSSDEDSSRAEEDLKEAFDLYDQDKDGNISSTELHQILNRLGEKCSVQDCTKMIQSVDSDGDGFVSFQEFKIMMSRSSQPDA